MPRKPYKRQINWELVWVRMNQCGWLIPSEMFCGNLADIVGEQGFAAMRSRRNRD